MEIVKYRCMRLPLEKRLEEVFKAVHLYGEAGYVTYEYTFDECIDAAIEIIENSNGKYKWEDLSKIKIYVIKDDYFTVKDGRFYVTDLFRDDLKKVFPDYETRQGIIFQQC